MARNLTKPLYQDNSDLGKSLGLFIRFWWAGIGTFISLILIIPRLLIAIIIAILPLIPIVQFILFLNRQI
jgi:hypothetical protein